jgi:hypothetical protein
VAYHGGETEGEKLRHGTSEAQNKKINRKTNEEEMISLVGERESV